MQFNVDKENNALHFKREFDAPLERVWKAWTDPELLDQWWAPKPWRAETKEMDFREGGHWLYAMVGPQGERHWARAAYNRIEPLQRIDALDAFCHDDGSVDENLPQATWVNRYFAENGRTTVTVDVTYNKLSDLETVLKMGMEEGIKMAQKNLDELLAAQATTAA